MESLEKVFSIKGLEMFLMVELFNDEDDEFAESLAYNPTNAL